MKENKFYIKGQFRERATITDISKSPKMPRIAIFFQEINDFLKIIRETIFSKLEHCGQNQVSGLHPKKSGVIFFKPKLLDPKHSGLPFLWRVRGFV